MANLMPERQTSPTIWHASDLHVGAHVPEMLAQFAELTKIHKPHLVILSGDLTDGGRSVEYDEFTKYLKTFTCPVFIVPGNHDSPVDNMFTRIFSPFKQFDALPAHKYLFQSEGIEVGELRTAAAIQARLDWSKGVTTHGRVIRALKSFKLPDNPSPSPTLPHLSAPFRILVGHHPIIDAPDVSVPGSVKGGLDALLTCEKAEIDLILSGHTHQSWFGRIKDSKVILATAPTLSSPRIRGEGQGFHAYTILEKSILCDVWRWDDKNYAIKSSKVQSRRGHDHAGQEPLKA